MNDHRSVFFFDGVCKFCNRSVNVLIRLDKRGRISYSALQGDLAKSTLTAFDRINPGSAIYMRKGRLLYRSSAVIYALTDASPWMCWVHIFRLIPQRWRDQMYSAFASNRYRWFGSYDSCLVPTENIRQRFIP